MAADTDCRSIAALSDCRPTLFDGVWQGLKSRTEKLVKSIAVLNEENFSSMSGSLMTTLFNHFNVIYDL
uniref:Uncharacterized protein n=1 Tax=Romanomermis culicivorax TaxID=13658 RepID=A0A915L482_ROMCU